MQALVSIVTGAKPDALTVPREAIVDGAVMAITANRVTRTPVRLGLVDAERVEITGGLAEGDLVALGSPNTLKTGDVVAPHVLSARDQEGTF